jgi:dihydroxy-acid dehydratase
MVWEDLRPSTILNRESFLNGAVAYMAMGGSTNAAIHLIAMAGRAGVELTLDDLSAVAGRVPVAANLFPSGQYLMEDFYFAGGILALMGKFASYLALDRPTVSGRTLGEVIAGAECWDDEIIRDEANPVVPLERGKTLQLLRGNLAPDGAVMKSLTADLKFLRHSGPAIVFDDPAEMNRTLDDPDLDITEDWVIVLRNAGPVGAPGMPEWGNLPIPKKLLRQGVRDMVRICDGRMSGTHYGTCILHVAPEAAIGGPLALLKTGDIVSIDIPAGKLDMEVDAAELDRRRAEWTPHAPLYQRSFAALYQRHVSQADKGCDFDFLEGTAPVPDPVIY